MRLPDSLNTQDLLESPRASRLLGTHGYYQRRPASPFDVQGIEGTRGFISNLGRSSYPTPEDARSILSRRTLAPGRAIGREGGAAGAPPCQVLSAAHHLPTRRSVQAS